ncbi:MULTISPECIES: ABC transporter substrate-binding protein [Micromonospora]|uniref:ABC transporter substrate-binding protein n=1 Tax=Micromonospora solifontis TaxID=2487138 RepID=A0ABX9WMR3_9ACTN|nr:MULTISPECIES: ABC transporter substrate-binding protein [Micromonospora]NES13345.1 ABC transporter substrate-binding protein [Micromonospora sp. PPF5-17B]NES34714.1 ABC transporter substrate-binding protein [Micromonospora solifontis]NES57230.1 ABC transporter substrate-binding protein [Micromonospora sp. PPF5-6]RNM01951.1 ABC transporter substrate-binding protein [Micromonospora solifontis]
MSRRTPRLFAAALAVGALLLGACAEQTSTDTPAAGSGSAAATFPVTVGKLTLEKRPEKIVSLSPTATEMLFAIGAGKQVTAVDDQSNYPAEAPKSDLSGYQPNAEAIAGKSPDLVVLANDTNKIIDQLTTLKIPVLLTPAAATLDDTYQQITDLGKLTGHPAEADAVTTKMKNDIAALTKDLPKRAAKLTYYHELGPELYSVTSKTFIGSIYALAGLENIADPADADGKHGGYPQLSQEVIVKANPDFVFLADTKCCKQTPDTVKARSGWAGVNAVKHNQIVALDDDIASRWGPRVVDLVKAIVDATAKVPA